MLSRATWRRLYRSRGDCHNYRAGSVVPGTDMLPQRSFCHAHSAFSYGRHVRVCIAASSPALVHPVRPIATYPKPYQSIDTIKQNDRTSKKYNYLNQQRLVETPRQSISQTFLRQCDDRSLVRRTDYRRLMENDIKEHIRFFSPELIDAVFRQRRHHDTVQVVFKGNIVYGFLAFTRVYTFVADQILSRERREELKALIAKTGAPPLDERAWERYTDPQTGKVNVGLIYPRWLNQMMHTMENHLEGIASGKSVVYNGCTSLQAYLILNYHDLSKVPSYEVWSHKQGPFKLADIKRSSLRMTSLVVDTRQRTEDLLGYTRRVLDEAFSALTSAQKLDMITEVHQRASELLARLRDQNLFAKTIALAMNALPEIRAIQNPFYTYRNVVTFQAMIEGNGTFRAPPPPSFSHWRALSNEEQIQYFCFSRKLERRPNTGLQLFVRYCTRDYGMSRTGAIHRYTFLTGLQKAALDYPFYFSLTRYVSQRVKFRRFVFAMASRWGMTCSNHSPGNLLFEKVMLKKWSTLSEEEQQRYSTNEGLTHAFPLLPTHISLDKSPTTLGGTLDGTHARPPSHGGDATDSERITADLTAKSVSVNDARADCSNSDTDARTSGDAGGAVGIKSGVDSAAERSDRDRGEDDRSPAGGGGGSGSRARSSKRVTRSRRDAGSTARLSARPDGVAEPMSNRTHHRKGQYDKSSRPSAPPRTPQTARVTRRALRQPTKQSKVSARTSTRSQSMQRSASAPPSLAKPMRRARTMSIPKNGRRGGPAVSSHSSWSPSSSLRWTAQRSRGGADRARNSNTSRSRGGGSAHRAMILARASGRRGGGSMAVMAPTRQPKPCASPPREGGGGGSGAKRRRSLTTAPVQIVV